MDYSKLRGLIRERYHTEKAFAEAIGMSAPVLSGKLNDRDEWKTSEISAACRALDISPELISVYFLLLKLLFST